MAVSVSVLAVVEALEFASDEMSSYVNRKSGEVRMVTHDDLRLAEDEDDPDAPDWQREAIEDAREVVASEDWVELPNKFDIHEWEIMDRFAASLSDDHASNQLRQSLRGRGAFRHFKATSRRLALDEAWFDFRRKALENIARTWIVEHGLQADESPRTPK